MSINKQENKYETKITPIEMIDTSNNAETAIEAKDDELEAFT